MEGVRIIGYRISTIVRTQVSFTYKFMDGQEIDLWERVVNLKDLGEVVHDLVTVVQGKASLLLQSACCVNSDRDVLSIVLALCERFHIFEIANCPCQKIGGHDGRTIEHNCVKSIPFARLDLLLRHVAKGNLILGNLKLDIKCCLEVRFVEAGEGTACIARLELGAEHVMEFVVFRNRRRNLAFRLVLGAVEACHDVVYGAFKLDLQLRLAREVNLFAKVQRHALSLLVI